MRIHRAAIALLALCLLASCKTAKPPAVVQQRDSLRTEVRHEITYVPDTVYVEIPAQRAERTTRDSISILQNDYALSLARVNKDGTLFHELRTKPQKKPAEVMRPVERRDSIVYKDKYKEVPVTVEKQPTKMERMKQKAFWPMLLCLMLAFIYIFRKPIGTLLKR